MSEHGEGSQPDLGPARAGIASQRWDFYGAYCVIRSGRAVCTNRRVPLRITADEISVRRGPVREALLSIGTDREGFMSK
jgi:hypothetical protein